jgi:hypothetical protein
MNQKNEGIDLLDGMTGYIAAVIADSEVAPPEKILSAIDALLAGAHSLSERLKMRCDASLRQPSRAKAPKLKSASAKCPKKPEMAVHGSGRRKPPAKPQEGSERVSGIQQGIRQATNAGTLPKFEVLPTLAPRAAPSLRDQKRAAISTTYGGMDDEKAMRQAAKAIAS